jgi:hypothetical protein
MKEKTAIEFLLSKTGQWLDLDEWKAFIAQAKELEKEQIMKAFYNGSLCDEGWGSDYAEAYYDETYQVEEAENE